MRSTAAAALVDAAPCRGCRDAAPRRSFAGTLRAVGETRAGAGAVYGSPDAARDRVEQRRGVADRARHRELVRRSPTSARRCRVRTSSGRASALRPISPHMLPGPRIELPPSLACANDARRDRRRHRRPRAAGAAAEVPRVARRSVGVGLGGRQQRQLGRVGAAEG